MKKKLYFGSNLKMYKTINETNHYLQNLNQLTQDLCRKDIELFIIPSYTALASACQSINQHYIKIGAQNMCWEDTGQFTGEISPIMLNELHIQLVMIGHSERRHTFLESDIIENKKVLTALRYGFQTLLCIGETANDKHFGISAEVLRTQLKIGLTGASSYDISKIRIAYEPVWSIGVDGTPATPEYAEQMHKVIKECLFEIFGKDSHSIPVLYGGSVNPSNANQLIVQPSIDGLFIGRAAWNAENFNHLIRSAINHYNSHI